MTGYRRTSYPWMSDPGEREGRLRRLQRRFRRVRRRSSAGSGLRAWAGTLLVAGVVFAAVFLGITRASEISGFIEDRSARAQTPRRAAPARVYYPTCAAARAAGQGPMHSSHPG